MATQKSASANSVIILLLGLSSVPEALDILPWIFRTLWWHWSTYPLPSTKRSFFFFFFHELRSPHCDIVRSISSKSPNTKLSLYQQNFFSLLLYPLTQNRTTKYLSDPSRSCNYPTADIVTGMLKHWPVTESRHWTTATREDLGVHDQTGDSTLRGPQTKTDTALLGNVVSGS
jgi:hypothetical protein